MTFGRGVGLGYRRELASWLLAAPRSVDFVEVVPETWRDPGARRELLAISEIWPVVPHGVKVSLGSVTGIDEARARDLARLARDLRAPVVSEHVSFVRAGHTEIGHLTELPMTRTAVGVVARNVERLRRLLPDVPLLLENVARGFVWPEDASSMPEGEFYAEIVRATGCDLLLDVGNLYANARNAGVDPFTLLASYPLEHVAMLHVAGGIEEQGFYFDTHAHPVPDVVFELAARSGCPCALLERDGGFDDSVFPELARLRTIASAAPEREGRPPETLRFETSADDELRLMQAQSRLADTLTGAALADDPAVERARGVLARKRADAALHHLRELGRRLSRCEAMTLGGILASPRAPTSTAVADAMRIASAARGHPELEGAANRDLALLNARYGGGPHRPRPRSWPVREALLRLSRLRPSMTSRRSSGENA